MRLVASEMLDSSGLRELDEAIMLGLVTVNEVGLGQGDIDVMMAEYVNHLKRALQDPTVHAVFDESAASLARSLVREGHVAPNKLTLTHAKEAAVGGGLLARLPSFQYSEMHDILALREDLRPLLGRYRRAVTSLSGHLQSQAYDEESATEIDDLWRTNVAPVLDELRDGLQQNAFVKHLATQVGVNPLTVAAGFGSPGAILLGIQSMTNIDSVVTALAAAAPAVASAASLAVRAASDRAKAVREVRGNDLFYLHEVNRGIDAP